MELFKCYCIPLNLTPGTGKYIYFTLETNRIITLQGHILQTKVELPANVPIGRVHKDFFGMNPTFQFHPL